MFLMSVLVLCYCMIKLLLTYADIIAGGIKKIRETQDGTHKKKKKMLASTENLLYIRGG